MLTCDPTWPDTLPSLPMRAHIEGSSLVPVALKMLMLNQVIGPIPDFTIHCDNEMLWRKGHTIPDLEEEHEIDDHEGLPDIWIPDSGD